MQRDQRALLAVPDRILDQIGEKLGEKLAVAEDAGVGAGVDIHGEAVALILDHHPVDVGDMAEQVLQVDRGKALAPGARLDLGDTQQRLERVDDGVDLAQRVGDQAAELGDALRADAGGIEPLAQAAERMFEVVGDVGGGLIDVEDQPFELVERLVDLAGDMVEVVAHALDGHAPVDLPFGDGGERRGKRVDLVLGALGKVGADQGGHDDGERQAPDQRAEQGCRGLDDDAVIAADQQLALGDRRPDRIEAIVRAAEVLDRRETRSGRDSASRGNGSRGGYCRR